MGLESGKRLGPYEIQSPLGAGGMGEVYRARDTRLDRLVAVKILPLRLSQDSNFRQRFEREARTISSLSHPNICTLFDVGREGDLDFLVLEYLEGETLSKRLERGPLLTDQLLRIGIEVSDALEKAHRQGITHRDLKPSNLMLTKTGTKLLDFGLAKLKTDIVPLPPALTERTADSQHKLTNEGALVGTFQYMAPEQLEGKEADARTDIFGFGHVLYEMATGRAAFTGKTKASLIASILSSEPPPISQLQPLAPPALERVVRTCLSKDPDERWQTAHDLKLQLQWIAQAGSEAGVPAPIGARRKTRERLAWVVAAVLLAATVAATMLYLRVAYEPTRAVRVSVLPPGKVFFETDVGPSMISPDGSKLAFVAREAGGADSLWLRPLDTLKPQLLAGTEGASFPFWSPDSHFIGFFAGGKLKKIEASGGPPQSLCDATDGRGGSWNRDDVIIFTPNFNEVIYRVSAAGGLPTPLTKLAQGQSSHRWPGFLPDGHHFLFFVHGSSPETIGTYASSLDGGPPRLILHEGSNSLYASPGYLLFVRERNLMAQHFDAGKLEIAGEPVIVAESVDVNPSVWRGAFSVSESGALVYHAPATSGGWQLAWFDRSGKLTGTVGQPDFYTGPALSPDGRRLAVNIGEPPSFNVDLWAFQLARGIKTRLTFGPGINDGAVWSPDGSRVAFLSNRKGLFHSYVRDANGTGADEPLIETGADERVESWSADGKYLAYKRQNSLEKKDIDVWILPLFGDRKPFPFLQTPSNEDCPQFSPDVKWLAYQSDESAGFQVYVVPFPSGNSKWQVSVNGGVRPRWRRDGRELFFLAPDNTLMAADITERGSTLEFGNPHALFKAHPAPLPGYPYDVSPDGKRFIFTNGTSQGNPEPATLVLNWTSGLKK